MKTFMLMMTVMSARAFAQDGGVMLDAGAVSIVSMPSDAGTDAGIDAGVSAPDAGPYDGIFNECPEVDYADGGHAPYAFPVAVPFGVLTQVTPDGGNDWYMPYPRGQRISCKLAACEERVTDYDAWAKPLPAWAVISAAISNLGFGLLSAYEICSKFPNLCKGL